MSGGVAGDLARAARMMREAPLISLAAVLSIALGIGATTAVFSLLNALVLRPLPVTAPERLVTISSEAALGLGFQAGAGWSYAMWDTLQRRREAFDGAFAWMTERVDLAGGGEMQPADALFASGSFFGTLGVAALLGRTFTPADDVPGGGPDGAVAVIGHGFWQRRFRGAPSAIGERLLVEGVPFTIIGVTPAAFFGVDVGQAFDIAIPLGSEPLIRGSRALVTNQQALLLTVMLRLKPAQSIADATAMVRALQPEILGAMRQAPSFLQEPFTLVPARTGIADRSRLRQQYARPLVTLGIVAALVLMVVCVNVAHLLLARAAARRHELSMRRALGASRWQLARQLLVESLALAAAGATVGLLFATWASAALVTQLPVRTTAVQLDLSADWRVLVFAVAVTTVAVAVFGTMPAAHAMRVAPFEVLRAQTHGIAAGRHSVASGLLSAQVALSMVLIVAAGLFVRTAERLASLPLGFEPEGVLVVPVSTARAVIDPAARLDYYQRVVDRIRALPGVHEAAGSMWTPMSGSGGGLLTDARGRQADTARSVAFNFVTPGWFDTYGTAMLAGRDIETRDGPDAPRAAVINETLARRFFGSDRTVGETIETGPCGRTGCTVVGIVGDAAYASSRRDGPPGTMYLPLAQSAGLTPPGSTTVRVSIRTDGDPTRVAPAVAAALRALDGGLTFTFRPLTADVTASLAQERLVAILAAFFGIVALVLSAIGLYGVTAYAVTRRRAEIGVRLALGAAPGAVVTLVLQRSAVQVAAGLVVGAAASLWLSRFVAPLVYGLEPDDPATVAAAALTLGAVTLVASWMPASRAARDDPARILRQH